MIMLYFSPSELENPFSSMTVYHKIEQNLSKINKLSGKAHTHQNYLQHYISLCLKLFLAKI